MLRPYKGRNAGGTPALPGELKFVVELGGGVGADPKVEVFGFDDPLTFDGAPELEFVFGQGEMKSLFGAGVEGDALEAFELADGAAGAACSLVNVELDDGVACASAGV